MATEFVERAGARVAFEDAGAGPALLLTHSFLCDRDMWRSQAEALAGEYRVISIDLRGHGESGLGEPPRSLYDLVGDVVAVLDHLAIGRAVWGGLSIGGMIALRAALTVPERVSGLILADTDAGAEQMPIRMRYRAMGLGTRLFGMGLFLTPICKLMFGATTLRTNPQLVSDYRGRFARLDLPKVLAILPLLTGRDSLHSRLGEIDIPALVIVGAEDRSLPVPRSEALAAGLPDAQLVVVDGAGHLSALEQPDAVTAAMRAFLQAHV